MSTLKNQEFSSWTVVGDLLQRIVFESHGNYLTRRDCDSYAAALLLQGMILEETLIDGSPLGLGLAKRWLNAIAIIKPFDLGTALKEWTVFFRNYIPGISSTQTWDGFKHRFRAVYPFVGEFFSPIRGVIESFFRAPESSTFSVIAQHVSFLSRLSLRDIDYSQDCLDEYLANEQFLSQFKYDYTLLDGLNAIMREWLADLSFEGFLPKHGPGAVAGLGRTSIYEKYLELRSDDLLTYFLKKCANDPLQFFPVMNPGLLDRCCEVVFVPKSVLTWRTISMEPSTLQYFQQGVWGCLDRHMSTHSCISEHVSIHDQSVNRRLASIGSANQGSYATLDLSAASDLVSWELVRHVFRGTPLLAACYATRSRFALLPSGVRIPMKKFAPMGSALCFPIECLIFAAICEYVVRDHGWIDKERSYSVYGDDIVIAGELAISCQYILGKCGFKLNVPKSYFHYNIPFRESCGGEYYAGVDVTPMRLSRKFSSDDPGKFNPGSYGAHIDGANRAFQYGYRGVRRWFISRLLLLPKKFQPLFGEDSRHLLSLTPTNFHLISKWHCGWQCLLVHCGTINPKMDKEILSEEFETIRLYEWFRITATRAPSALLPEDVCVARISRVRPVMGTRLALRPEQVSADEDALS
jgi:hypothetical protein